MIRAAPRTIPMIMPVLFISSLYGGVTVFYYPKNNDETSVGSPKPMPTIAVLKSPESMARFSFYWRLKTEAAIVALFALVLSSKGTAYG